MQRVKSPNEVAEWLVLLTLDQEVTGLNPPKGGIPRMTVQGFNKSLSLSYLSHLSTT